MKSLFEKEAYDDILGRIEKLDENTSAQWGKMDVAQMLYHCQQPLDVAIGRKTLKKPNFIMKLILRSIKSSMYNDKPWKPGSPTVAEYKVTSNKDFNTEKEALLALIGEFYEYGNSRELGPHIAFGQLTHDQWGMMQYKHLDHHLRQFGI